MKEVAETDENHKNDRPQEFYSINYFGTREDFYTNNYFDKRKEFYPNDYFDNLQIFIRKTISEIDFIVLMINISIQPVVTTDMDYREIIETTFSDLDAKILVVPLPPIPVKNVRIVEIIVP